MPRIKTRPEDFVVDEVGLYDPSGEGDVTLVRARKHDLETEDVARRFAECLGTAPASIGFAGRKDRRSVSSQWFSLPGWRPEVEPRLASEGVEVLEVARHADRLRPGDLHGNRFRIHVREVAEDERRVAIRRFEQLEGEGMANPFGAQRFGRGARNVEQGRKVLSGEVKMRDRRQARFLISAFQAHLFNEMITRRGVPVSRLLEGEVVFEHRRGRPRPVRDLAADQALADALSLSPTGPIFGAKMRWPRGRAAVVEKELWREQNLPDWSRPKIPRHLVPKGGRHPLRVPVESPVLRELDDGLELQFALPAGSFATVLIASLFDEEVVEGSAP